MGFGLELGVEWSELDVYFFTNKNSLNFNY